MFMTSAENFLALYIPMKVRKSLFYAKNKASDENPGKSYLEEGVIYYRYGGSSKRIQYEELSAIIQEERDKVHEQWRRTLGQITSSGLEKVSVLDLESKALISDGTPVYIDEGLASQLSFVKEGHFVDNGGSPTLMLKGTVETAGSAKPILIPKQVPTSINDTEIFEAFLTSEGVSSPELYIKQICFQTSGNLPVYYFMQQAGLSAQETLNLLNETNRNSRARETLEKRLTKGNTAKGTLGQATTKSGKMKQYYHDRICRGQSASPSNPNELKYYLSAIRGMDNSEIRQFRDVVLEALYSIFKNYLYKDDYKIIIQEFRYACCWLDEALYSE